MFPGRGSKQPKCRDPFGVGEGVEAHRGGGRGHWEAQGVAVGKSTAVTGSKKSPRAGSCGSGRWG